MLLLIQSNTVPIFDATAYWERGPKAKHILQLDDLRDCPQITENPPINSLVAAMYTVGKYTPTNTAAGGDPQELLAFNIVALVLLCRPKA